MKKNFIKKLFENKIAIGFLSCIIILMVSISIILLYKLFYNSNIKSIQTVSDINENLNSSDIVVEVNDLQQAQQENENIPEEKQEENITKEDEKQDEKKVDKKEENKNNNSNYKYYLKVNYTANTVTAYGLDGNGNYTIPVRAMICSTGAATPTSGVYKTLNKYRWKLLIGNSYGQYSTRITGQILFHSVPYEKQSEDSIITKYYDRLGITTSLGCIRLTVIDAKWIYDNCPLGTQVEFYASSNPGPLGKPSAMKITDFGYPLNKWDPTDPNPNNPWKNNSNQTNDKTNNTTNNTTNNITDNVADNSTANNVADNTANNVVDNTANNVVDNTTNNVVDDTTNNVVDNTTNNVVDDETNNVADDAANNVADDAINNTTNNTINNTSDK